ncbi:MAG TPA: molybdopterin converting factor subunit 1 [Polyangiaceae bacterium]
MPTPVTLLYFAAIRDVVGIAEESLDLPDNVQLVADLPAFLELVRPALAGRLGSVRFAVNETFATPDTGLAAGDVIALIPPVSGG